MVNNSLSTIKAATVKNKSRRQLLDPINFPPLPIITQWGSWIEAAVSIQIIYPKLNKYLKEWKEISFWLGQLKVH